MFLAFFLFVAILRLQLFGVYRMAESYGSCSLAVNCFKNVQVSKCQNQWEVKILFVVHPCRAPVNAILSDRAKIRFPDGSGLSGPLLTQTLSTRSSEACTRAIGFGAGALRLLLQVQWGIWALRSGRLHRSKRC